MDKRKYTDINAKAIDAWVEEGWEWGVPISREAYRRAASGELAVLLTPQIFVPEEWFAPYFRQGSFNGAKILGLASGGGQQMPVFAALGADCTVLDYSDRQLESERAVAAREGYAINIVKADMTERLPFDDQSFDLIFHPISNCYVEDVYHVWRECYRVLRPGGVLIAGMDNSIAYLFEDGDAEPLIVKNRLPYNPLKDSKLLNKDMLVDGSVQFSHSITEQLGGQLMAGLCLTHLYEDRQPEGALSKYTPLYIATRAVRA